MSVFVAVGVMGKATITATSERRLVQDLAYLPGAEPERLRAEYARVIQMLTNLVKSLGGTHARRPA